MNEAQKRSRRILRHGRDAIAARELLMLYPTYLTGFGRS